MEGAETRRQSGEKEAMSAMSGVATARNKLARRAFADQFGKARRRDAVAGLLEGQHVGRQDRAGRNIDRRDDRLLEDPLHVAERGEIVLVDRVACHCANGPQALHEVLELRGLGGIGGVGAVHAATEGEMLLNHTGPERHGREGGVVVQSVVGVADRKAPAAGHFPHDIETDTFVRARIGRRALQDNDIVVVLADRGNRGVELGPV